MSNQCNVKFECSFFPQSVASVETTFDLVSVVERTKRNDDLYILFSKNRKDTVHVTLHCDSKDRFVEEGSGLLGVIHNVPLAKGWKILGHSKLRIDRKWRATTRFDKTVNRKEMCVSLEEKKIMKFVCA